MQGKKADQYQMTIMARRDERVKGSSLGDVTWEQWCEAEVGRLRSKGREAMIDGNGRIAVFVATRAERTRR